jgi:hypothetical protein
MRQVLFSLQMHDACLPKGIFTGFSRLAMAQA